MELEAFSEISPRVDVDVLVREGGIENPFNPDQVGIHTFGGFRYDTEQCYYEHPDDGSKILVHKQSEHTEVIFHFASEDHRQTVLSYFYGTGLSALLHYNRSIPIHASGVTRGDDLYLFCGRSGIGKSTLATSLKLKGYDLFADDKCVLSDQDGSWTALPGLTIMRLWQNTLDAIDPSPFLHDAKEVVFRKEKYQYQIVTAHLDLSPKQVKAIYIIVNVDADQTLSAEELMGQSKLAMFQRQIFRRQMISGMGLQQHLWHFLVSVLSDIPVYLISRPKETQIDTFSDYMNDQLLSLSE